MGARYRGVSLLSPQKRLVARRSRTSRFCLPSVGHLPVCAAPHKISPATANLQAPESQCSEKSFYFSCLRSGTVVAQMAAKDRYTNDD